MTEPIDWMSPITAHPSAGPLYGGDETASWTLSGIREEQIRRARILTEATGGRPLKKGNAARVVADLAADLPGLRYRVGRIIQTGLAPATSLFGDDLPGKEMGRPEEWTADRCSALVEMVDEVKARHGRPITDTAALRLIIADWRKRGGHPPSLKTLQSRLSNIRGQLSGVA